MSNTAYRLARLVTIATAVIAVAWAISWSDTARYNAMQPAVTCIDSGTGKR